MAAESVVSLITISVFSRIPCHSINEVDEGDVDDPWEDYDSRSETESDESVVSNVTAAGPATTKFTFQHFSV